MALKTEPDEHNHLILVQRWGLVAVLCAVAFAGSLLRSFLKARATPAAKPRRALPADPRRRQIIARVGLALLIAYPFIAVALAGTSGSIKWIENFGVQILLYILLAWGLNIVVGLAGSSGPRLCGLLCGRAPIPPPSSPRRSTCHSG